MLSFEVSMRTGNGLNSREHPMARSRRVKEERRRTAAGMFGAAVSAGKRRVLDAVGEGPWFVTITRRSPATRPMDDDNLPGALKAIRDEVAKQLQVDDGDRAMVRWEYRQERGAWAVAVTVVRWAA